MANAGTLEAWSNLWRIAVSEGVSGAHADNYRRLLGQNPDGSANPAYPVLLDPEHLAAFMINVHYMVDVDSPATSSVPNNMYALRDRNDADDGLVRRGFFFLRHDAEHSMGTERCMTGTTRRNSCKVTDDSTARGTELANSTWKTFAQFSPAELNYALLKNPDYKMLFADAFYRHCLRPGGALTVEKATERFRARMTEIDDAVVCESARWARKGQIRETWLAACGECLWFITNRMPHMVAQYRNRGWYPSIDAPVIARVDGTPVADGEKIDSGTQVRLTGSGTLYYTLEGSDPRAPGGIVSEQALVVPENGLVTLPNGKTTIRVRAKTDVEWSAEEQVTLTVPSENDQAVVQ